jgi:hypothetical protein
MRNIMENNTLDEATAILISGIAGIGITGLAVLIAGRIACTNLNPSLLESQVVGDATPDKFYEINGKKAYLEIDGKSVDEYFKMGD